MLVTLLETNKPLFWDTNGTSDICFMSTKSFKADIIYTGELVPSPGISDYEAANTNGLCSLYDYEYVKWEKLCTI